jgi:hypoxanthine phosphoribosyltransferase
MSEFSTEILIPAHILDHRIKQMAKQISEQYFEQLKANPELGPLVILMVLLGGTAFAIKLLQELYTLGIDAELHSVSASSYGDEKQSAGRVNVQWQKDPQVFKGRAVVIAEDLIDTGLTVSELVKVLMEYCPASVLVAVMIDKPEARTFDIDAELLVGLSIINCWIKGGGINSGPSGRGDQNILAEPQTAQEVVDIRAYRTQLEEDFAETRAIEIGTSDPLVA